MSKLLDKLAKTTKIKEAAILCDSALFAEKESITTDIPGINIALSGEIDGGLRPGITSIAGMSKHFKSSYALLMAAAYMKKHSDAVILFYGSEFGSPQDYFQSFGIDVTRVLHIPITTVEELKFDLMQKLDNANADGIKRGDKVFILIDSIGNLASVKEANDAVTGNTAQDMSRPKMLKSFFRLVTPHLTLKNIPMVVIQHVYQELGLFPKTIMSGGQGGMLASDNVWIVGKSQEKDGTELVGYNFTITIEKSRYVKEKSKIPIRVTFDGGISKYSGILDLALEAGEVVKPTNGWYSLVNKETGEIGGKVRAKDTEREDFLGEVLKRESFRLWVKDRYKLAQGKMIADEFDNEMINE
jgi:RecA/RadA recombinase